MAARLKDMPVDDSRLGDFRIDSPAEIAATLKRLADANVPLSLHAPTGISIAATLWTAEAQRGLVSFSLLPNETQLDALVECDEATVVGYLDSIRLQFDVNHLVLVHRGSHTALNAAFPGELFRFQRRSGFRVQPLVRSAPVATLRHPMIPDMQLGLRVLDVSIGGCALFLPHDVPPLDPGVLMNGVVLDLDADTRVMTGLRLQHVTSINPDSGGVRLGCEMVAPQADGLRALQRYIDQTQKRRRMLTLD
ncbi:flagellar brake protein [Piscinibacter sp. XHJ-5]|uniref:flagellar brake protein n=1 Tax=Piscinibacter sp. XHJ-5 TaxID=3037797 RepID=UPI0024532087|nr:flagellar brake protein [Piscinibacter sp. XHJ-5]